MEKFYYYTIECTKQTMQSQLDQAGAKGYKVIYINWLGTNSYLIVMERREEWGA